jgi:branched-chain amino acid aminotransferase
MFVKSLNSRTMVILDGKEIENGNAELSLLNRSFRYGDGLFETIRVYKQKPLFLPDHFDRLLSGMHFLAFDFDPLVFRKTVESQIGKLIRLNGITDHGRLRLQVFRSGGGDYTPSTDIPAYLLEGFPLSGDPYLEPAQLSLTAYTEVGLWPGPLSRFKTSNSLPYILAASFAKANRFDDAILFCSDAISECSSANLFLIRKQHIFTPPLESACLDGIMRRQIFRLAGELKLPVREKKIIETDLLEADECFVTNTVKGIRPVIRYNARKWENRYPITRLLQQSLLRLAESLSG